MLANPNKPIDVLLATIPQKYFVFVVLGLGHFMLPFAWANIIAVLLVSISLHSIRSKQILNPAAARIERIICKGSTTFMGYITAEASLNNA